MFVPFSPLESLRGAEGRGGGTPSAIWRAAGGKVPNNVPQAHCTGAPRGAGGFPIAPGPGREFGGFPRRAGPGQANPGVRATAGFKNEISLGLAQAQGRPKCRARGTASF